MTIANVEQAAAWDGPEGANWAEYADRFDTAISRTWQRFLDANLIFKRDNVLDIGCGNGKSTRDAARVASSGSVLGIDLSTRMLELARQRSAVEGIRNVDYLQADAQVHPFNDNAFDIAISRFGVMFFSDPVAAFANIARSLRPSGRLALIAWRGLTENEWQLVMRNALAIGRTLPAPPLDAPGPFGFADSDRVRGILGDAGYTDINFEVINEPVEFGNNADDAFGFVRTQGFVKGMTQDLDDAGKAQALDALRRVLIEHDTGHGVLLDTSSWLITARRR
ncbi:MAG: methyltransferase domain-containing protein [Ilumatobacteraceae bacterium]